MYSIELTLKKSILWGTFKLQNDQLIGGIFNDIQTDEINSIQNLQRHHS